VRGGVIGLMGSLLILNTTSPRYSDNPRLFVVGFFCTPLGVVIGLLARVIQMSLEPRARTAADANLKP